MDGLFRGIEYIEEHLFDDLTVHDVARAACYSDFHFSRMFRALVGESLMGYVRKRRLSVAAQRLVSDDVRLIDLAFDCKFDSQEAFTRAFKRMFDLTPGEYRKLSDPVRLNYRRAFTPEAFQHLREGMTMQPRIVSKAGFKVVGLQMDFDQDSAHEIGKLWDRFGPLMHTVPSRVGVDAFGVCQSKDLNKVESAFSYIAGVEVSALGAVPEGMVGLEISEQEYAVFTHRVTSLDISAEIKGTLEYIWGTWLPSSDYEYSGSPDFELYDERFNPQSASGEFDIYIPIKKKD